MALIEGVQVYTDSGYKKIEDISGKDKVLVRNFIGHAQFIQPFAIKKSHYEGDIISIGGKSWSLTATPQHMLVYDKSSRQTGLNIHKSTISDIIVSPHNRIQRNFRYSPEDTYKNEFIDLIDEFGRRRVYISNQDWFVLIAFVLRRGSFKPTGKRRKSLLININKDDKERELILLIDILDRIGVKWSLNKLNNKPVVRVSSSNTLSARIINQLGSDKRYEMSISDKMIYNGSRELAKAFFSTLSMLVHKVPKKNLNYSTNNLKLVNSLELFCILWGYNPIICIAAKKGKDQGRGALKKDMYRVSIHPPISSYSPSFKHTSPYSGNVYEIVLFEGQIYTKERTMPVWVDPK